MTRILSALSFAAVIGFAGASLAAAPSFDEVDTNKDGMLSKAEASKVETLDFAKADTNKDGMISRSEYQAAIG